MRERLHDRIKRWIDETRKMRYKRIIRKYVQKLDAIDGFAFMAYTWALDDVTDYHVLAERSYPDMHVFGTKWERYEEGKRDDEGGNQRLFQRREP